ncbi:TPA: hypothetical protein ACMWW0_001964 [Legionella pneumophila]|nr:hypothetical protein [Legionella pneumophila]HBD9260112.1 hypothetical protein [Legionella pneumophila]HCX3262842.1 hypothetical protein [Legionella pneumophila]HCX3599066.1 hypothetical protein [Legionella pneumophila]HDI4841928.1 hypothetical protein [Legionella pneumophila]
MSYYQTINDKEFKKLEEICSEQGYPFLGFIFSEDNIKQQDTTNEISGEMTISRSGKSKTYKTGHDSSWLQDFENDLKNDYFSDSNFTHKIYLDENPEYKNLYDWSLKEGKKGESFVPLEDTWLYFTASELRYNYSFDILSTETCNLNRAEINTNIETTEEKEGYISGSLHPGISQDAENLEHNNTYSMLGTDREIKKFSIIIKKTKNPDDQAECKFGGNASSTFDLDVSDITFDDEIFIHLTLKPKQFDYIAELIKFKRMDRMEVMLVCSSGLYSFWEPYSSMVHYIKVLTNSKDHKVIIPEGSKIVPPRLGLSKVDFNLKIIQRCLLNSKQDLSDTVEDNDQNIQDENIQKYEQMHKELLNRLERLEKIVGFPLWVILGGLFGVYILGPALLQIIPVIKDIFLHFFPNAASFFDL